MNFKFTALFLAFGIATIAAPIPASCNSSNTLCGIPSNVQIQLPFIATAGDTIVVNPTTSAVVDVFRIVNNFVNTGLGTGLGNLAFLYTATDADLPAPATYSANVVTVPANLKGYTTVTSGTHSYLLAAPEPASLTLSALGALLLLWCILNRVQNSKVAQHA